MNGKEDATYSATSFEPSPGVERSRYDPGSMSRMDVDGVMEDIEKQLAIRPAYERGGEWGRERRLLCCLVLCLAAVGIGVGVPMAQGGGGTGGGGAAGGGGGRGAGSAELGAPPEFLSAVCAPDMIAEPDGYGKCEELCEVAVCCFVPESDEVSCVKNKEEICQEYKSSCRNLDANQTEESGKNATDTDMDTDKDTSEGGDTEAQGGSQAGADVDEDDLKLAVDAACKDDVISLPGGEAACEALCSPSACCFAGDGPSCADDGVVVQCAEYVACAVLHTDNSVADSDAVGATKKAIDAACEKDAISQPEGLEKCQEICRPGDCCYAKGDAFCVDMGLDVICHDYYACEVLHEDDDDGDEDDDDDLGVEVDEESSDGNKVGSDAATKAYIEAVCKKETISEPGRLEKCEETCRPGDCCFAKGSAYCPNMGLDVVCHDFYACAVLYESVNKDSEEPTGGGTAGSDATAAVTNKEEESLGEDKAGSDASGSEQNATKTLVEAGGMEDNASDGVENVNTTDAATQGTGDADGSANTGEMSTVDRANADGTTLNEDDEIGGQEIAEKQKLETAERIIRLCSEEKVATELGRAECEKVCLSHLCCFAPVNDCSSTLGIECLEYAACEVLIDWSNEP